MVTEMDDARHAAEEREGTLERAASEHELAHGPTFMSLHPADAPPMPKTHSRLGVSSQCWTYHNADGSVAYYVSRFDRGDGEKAVLPLTLWRGSEGALRWEYKAPPSPRVLYGLAELAQRPDALVVVTEGEKAADAASKIFPRAVAVTSSGGANAFKQSDWSPLAGRNVVIWPDADVPGEVYAENVANILSAQDCEVSVVDPYALSARNPSGGERGARQGWDAADALEEWSDPSADLISAALASLRRHLPPPKYLSFGPFEMTRDGLFHKGQKGRSKDDDARQEFISSAFEVLGACRDPKGVGWGKLLSWRDADGREHSHLVTEASLQADPAALCASLADKGVRIDRNRQKDLVRYLARCAPNDRVTVVHRTGWHEIAGKKCFVLPGESICGQDADTVVLDASAIGPYASAGTLAEWQSAVAEPTQGHLLPMLAICVALSGPVLEFSGQDGGGLHFFGPSSRGKTTLAQIAASVWGSGGTPGYVRTWRATANGLEGAAASATDTLLVLDELGMVDPREVAPVVYALSNGTGKQRATRSGDLRAPKTWRVVTISTGEIPLANKLEEAPGRKARAGQLIRMIDVPSDRGLGFGVFDHAGDQGDPGTLANQLKEAAANKYGTAGPEFVRRLLEKQVSSAEIQSAIARFVKAFVAAGSEGQVQRVAQRFALFEVAGELAIDFGVLPWEKGAARKAAAWGFDQFIKGRGGFGPAEEHQAIAQVRRFLTAYGDSRFEDLSSHDADGGSRPIPERVGWRRGYGGGRTWMIPSEMWRTEVCEGLDPKFVARTLAKSGHLKVGHSELTSVCNIHGSSQRCYVITGGIFTDDNHEEGGEADFG